MFMLKEDMHLWKRNVESKDLEKELKNIFNTFSATNMKQFQPEPYNHKSKPYYRFRIMEYGLRIKDFSFFNFRIKTNGDVVYFETKKGHEENWIFFSDKLDIIFDDKHSTIILNVLGYVKWLDGTRRYDGKYEYMAEKFVQDNSEEQYKNSNFLNQRRITKKSRKHIEKIKENIKQNKKKCK